MRDDSTVFVVAYQAPNRLGIRIAGDPIPHVFDDPVQAARLADQLDRAGALPRTREQDKAWWAEIRPDGSDA